MSTQTVDGVADAEVVAEPQSRELVPTTGAAVFDLTVAQDVTQVLGFVGKIADGLKQFVQQQKLTVRIGQSDHIRVEGWQILSPILNVTPSVTETRQIVEDEKVVGYEAWAELRDTRSGGVVGTGKSRCMRSESRWAKADEFQVESMAQTRAIGKAYRNTFGFIAKAAGFEATPAEELEGTAAAPAKATPVRTQAESPPHTGTAITAAQRRKLFAEAKKVALTDEKQMKAIVAWIAGTEHTDRIAKDQFDAVLAAVADWQATVDEIVSAANTEGHADAQRAQKIVARFMDAEQLFGESS